MPATIPHPELHPGLVILPADQERGEERKTVFPPPIFVPVADTILHPELHAGLVIHRVHHERSDDVIIHSAEHHPALVPLPVDRDRGDETENVHPR